MNIATWDALEEIQERLSFYFPQHKFSTNPQLQVNGFLFSKDDDFNDGLFTLAFEHKDIDFWVCVSDKFKRRFSADRYYFMGDRSLSSIVQFCEENLELL